MRTQPGLWYTDGAKAVSVGDFDNFLDWMIDQGGELDGTIRLSVAMQKVAFVYRCVRLISDALRAVPWRLVPIGSDDVWDDSKDYQNKLKFLPDPKRIIELLARSLLGPGAAYLFKTMQGTILRDLRYMVASTLEPEIDSQDGLLGFYREVGGKRIFYDVDRFVYFWPADEMVELGPPMSSPVKAALTAAGADYYTAKFIADFFARGAIKGTLLAVKGNPVESERKRLKDWFQRTFFSGSQTSFNTEIINADAIEPVKIGEGLESLNNSELTRQMREDIAVAMGVPMSKLLSGTVSGLGGGGVAESDDLGFYQDTVKPLGEFVSDTLNGQLLNPLGYRWIWLWDTLDVFQQDEVLRSQAFSTYAAAGIRPEVAAYMLGIEIPDPADVPEHYVLAFDMPEAESEIIEATEEQKSEPDNGRVKTVEYLDDLDKWQRMALKRYDEGNPEKALGFRSDLIPLNLQAGIRKALEGCTTGHDVMAMFGRVDAAQKWLAANA